VLDNPALLRVNPEYLTWLLLLPTLERERLLSGTGSPGAAVQRQSARLQGRFGSRASDVLWAAKWQLRRRSVSQNNGNRHSIFASLCGA
jgi:hypothetical protein